jgi:hypothetical protein
VRQNAYTIAEMTKREEELIGSGWERRFVTMEPRLSEMKEMYESIGFEVLLEPLPSREEFEDSGCEESGCTACFDMDPERYRIIYTRSKDE